MPDLQTLIAYISRVQVAAATRGTPAIGLSQQVWLLPRLQSAYHVGHSTETAVLKVLSDILLAIDSGDLSALVLLYLSAAFDTVDHNILIQCHVLRSVWNNAAVVPDVPCRPVPVRPNRSLSISSNSDCVWCTAGVRSWPYLVPAIHCRPDSADPGTRSLPTSTRRRHTDLYRFCRLSASLELQNTITNCVDDVARWMRSNS